MPQYPTVPLDVLAARYERGETFRQIAQDYDVSFQALAAQYKRAGRQARPKAPRKYFLTPCSTCGTLFVPRNGTTTHCSRDCIPWKDVAKGRPQKTMCKYGHLLTPDNLYPKHGTTPRRCKACCKKRNAEYRTKQKEKHGHG